MRSHDNSLFSTSQVPLLQLVIIIANMLIVRAAAVPPRFLPPPHPPLRKGGGVWPLPVWEVHGRSSDQPECIFSGTAGRDGHRRGAAADGQRGPRGGDRDWILPRLVA
eukprot:7774147-Pyramimonas_sp.AAC.1